jgi:hypothetical protein
LSCDQGSAAVNFFLSTIFFSHFHLFVIILSFLIRRLAKLVRLVRQAEDLRRVYLLVCRGGPGFFRYCGYRLGGHGFSLKFIKRVLPGRGLPLPKCGSPTGLSKFRSISIHPVLSKGLD